MWKLKQRVATPRTYYHIKKKQAWSLVQRCKVTNGDRREKRTVTSVNQHLAAVSVGTSRTKE